MIVVDASVWVSSLFEDDTHFLSSDVWLHDWIMQGHLIFVPGIMLPEVAGAVTRRTLDKQAGVLALETLLEHPAIQVVEVDAELAERSARLAIQCVLRGADAVYVALAERLGIPLITWDRGQLLRAHGVVQILQPLCG